MGGWLVMILILGTGAAVIGGEGPGVADRVVFRNGQVLLGQVVVESSVGKVRVVVRREWAVQNLPERAGYWEQADLEASKRAVAARLRRVEDWRAERRVAKGGEVIDRWLEGEITRLREGAGQEATGPLMELELDRRQVQRVDRRTSEAGTLLRQAWLAGFEAPEEQGVEQLKRRLEGRGFAVSGVDQASIGALLGLRVETDERWYLRRAATEVKHDAGLRYSAAMGMVFPEGEEPGPEALASAFSSVLGELLGEGAGKGKQDPLAAVFRAVEARGQVGVETTALELAPGAQAVRVESILWVRVGPGRWIPAVRRPVSVTADQVAAGEGAALAADPQVRSAFQVLEGLTGGAIGQELKQRSLDLGGAGTRRALGMAQSALGREIEALALPVR